MHHCAALRNAPLQIVAQSVSAFSLQVSDLHAAAEAARLHYEQEIARWERRLAEQARTLDKEGSVKRMEAVAAERREANEKLQEVEGRLQGELNQARHVGEWRISA